MDRSHLPSLVKLPPIKEALNHDLICSSCLMFFHHSLDSMYASHILSSPNRPPKMSGHSTSCPLSRGRANPGSSKRSSYSLDHLPSTDDMIGTQGLPSCLFGFFTRRTRNGGKRMGLLTMMDATDCDSARRRGRQFRIYGARVGRRSGASQRSRAEWYVVRGVPRVWQGGRLDMRLKWWSSCRG